MYNQTRNAWARVGHKQKQPLADFIPTLKAYYCTWSSFKREGSINRKSLHCAMSIVSKTFWPQLQQDVCLNKRVKTQGQTMRSVKTCFFIPSCKCSSFKSLLQRDEDDPSNLTVAGVTYTVKFCIILRRCTINHRHTKGKARKKEKKEKSKPCLLEQKIFQLNIWYI